MWWLGMMILAGGGGSFNIPSGDISTEEFDSSVNEVFGSGFDVADFFFQFWWSFLILGVLVFLLIVITAVLHYIAIGGLYYGADQARQGKEKVRFGDMMKGGWKKFWPVLGLHVLVSIALGIVGLIIAIPLILLAITIIGLIIVIPVVIILLILALPTGGIIRTVMAYATQYVVFHDEKIIDSLKKGWQLFKNNLSDSIVVFLLELLVRIVVGFVTFGIILLIALPLAILGFILYTSTGWVGAGIVIALALLVLFTVGLVIRGIKNTFLYNMWHLAFAELTAKT